MATEFPPDMRPAFPQRTAAERRTVNGVRMVFAPEEGAGLSPAFQRREHPISCPLSVVSCQLPLRPDPVRGEMFIARVPPHFAPFGAELKRPGTDQDIFRSERRWVLCKIPTYEPITPSGVNDKEAATDN